VNIGAALQSRFAMTGNQRDADAAIRAWSTAAGIQTGEASARVNAAERWGALAVFLGKASSALDGYTTAVRHLPMAAWRGVGKASLERLIEDRLGLACDAGACAVQAGLPEQGIELLEQARGIMWAQMLETRTDLSGLTEARPELAAQLNSVRAALDCFEWSQLEE